MKKKSENSNSEYGKKYWAHWIVKTIGSFYYISMQNEIIDEACH